jgi:hypothetical protein
VTPWHYLECPPFDDKAFVTFEFQCASAVLFSTEQTYYIGDKNCDLFFKEASYNPLGDISGSDI